LEVDEVFVEVQVIQMVMLNREQVIQSYFLYLSMNLVHLVSSVILLDLIQSFRMNQIPTNPLSLSPFL